MKHKRVWIFTMLVMLAITVFSVAWATSIGKGIQKLDDYIVVSIDTNDGGYYSLLSDCELAYYDGKLVSVHLDSPSLMSFSVPSRYNGGVCVASGADVTDIIRRLEEIRNRCADDETAYNELSEIIEELNKLPITTGAST